MSSSPRGRSLHLRCKAAEAVEAQAVPDVVGLGHGVREERPDEELPVPRAAEPEGAVRDAAVTRQRYRRHRARLQMCLQTPTPWMRTMLLPAAVVVALAEEVAATAKVKLRKARSQP